MNISEIEGKIPSQFIICEIENGKRYSMLNAESGDFFDFLDIQELKSKVYEGFIIKFRNENLCYAYFKFSPKDDVWKIHMSRPFKKVILETNDFLIIKTFADENKIIHHHSVKFKNWNNTCNNVIRFMPSGKLVIIRNDFNFLIIGDAKGAGFSYCAMNPELNNYVRVIKCADGFMIIRISNFETYFADYVVYVSKEYLKLIIDGKENLIRVTDGKTSEPFKFIDAYPKYGYAFVSDDMEHYKVLKLD